MKIWLVPLLVICLACSGPANPPDYPGLTVLRDVQVIDIRSGQLMPEQDIVIDSGRILEIKPTGYVYEQATIIPGNKAYVLPGLAEMHAHIPSPGSPLDLEEVLFLYLSNGVTTIRGMLGHPSHLELREQAANNEILSPRIYTSSPSLNGNTVQTVEEARQMVTAYKNDGYDFLKLHPGIRLHVFEEIVRTAKEVGIPFAGHVSLYVGVRRAIRDGYATIDHVDGFIEGLVPASAGVDPTNNGFFGYNFAPLVDMSLLDELVSGTRANNVWVVPTQSLFDRWFSPQPPEELAAEPEMRYLPQSYVERWVDNKNRLIGLEGYDPGKWENFNASRKHIIKKLHQEGQGLLLGSDAPQVFNVPGFSIHHELKGMRDAGLSPLEALQIGTINVTEYFDQTGAYGELIPGASADLILLEQNPLDNLSNLRNPLGIMVRGQWIDRKMIDQRLAEIAENAKTK